MKTHIRQIQHLASVLSELGCSSIICNGFGKTKLCKTDIPRRKGIEIKNGRHPVVEKMMDHSLYVPNNCILTDEANMLLITGPNMSGKSTYMRQVALIVVMAQIGCYVPCDQCITSCH